MNIKKIKNNLKTKIIGSEIFYFDTLDSTNSYLKRQQYSKLINGQVVVADNQTAGRGRYDRKWLTQPGKNLTFSILIKPDEELKEFSLLSIFTASAVSLAIEEITGLQIKTKWPNDLILNNKKLGGILVETSFEPELKKIIVGIGINVNQKDFDEEIRFKATSLFIESGKEYDRELLLSQILNSFESMFFKLIERDYMFYFNDWNKRCNHIGKKIFFEYHGKKYEGITKALAPDGCLVVNTNGNEYKLSSGEIIIKIER